MVAGSMVNGPYGTTRGSCQPESVSQSISTMWSVKCCPNPGEARISARLAGEAGFGFMVRENMLTPRRCHRWRGYGRSGDRGSHHHRCGSENRTADTRTPDRRGSIYLMTSLSHVRGYERGFRHAHGDRTAPDDDGDLVTVGDPGVGIDERQGDAVAE